LFGYVPCFCFAFLVVFFSRYVLISVFLLFLLSFQRVFFVVFKVSCFYVIKEQVEKKRNNTSTNHIKKKKIQNTTKIKNTQNENNKTAATNSTQNDKKDTK